MLPLSLLARCASARTILNSSRSMLLVAMRLEHKFNPDKAMLCSMVVCYQYSRLSIVGVALCLLSVGINELRPRGRSTQNSDQFTEKTILSHQEIV